MTGAHPREGMMAVVRNRRAMIMGVQPFDADGDLESTAALVAVFNLLSSVARLAIRLNCNHEAMSPYWVGAANHERQAWRASWAVTRAERLRLKASIDAMIAVLYDVPRNDLLWILRDCDQPRARIADKAFCRTLDPKGFWRVDRTEEPELRHTVLSLAAFDDLQVTIAAAGGDREAGIRAFCDQHDGDGWMLPETLCLADLGLTRTVDVGAYDARARTTQPVRSRMGERFLDWQLAQTPEESWAECERHAKAILDGAPAPVIPKEVESVSRGPASEEQLGLFGPQGPLRR